jgi:hypothetical protein
MTAQNGPLDRDSLLEESQVKSGTVPVQALLGEDFDDMGPYQISISTMTGKKSNDAIDSPLIFLFIYHLLCASGLACKTYVTFLQMSEEDKQVRIEHAQFLSKVCFFARLGKAEPIEVHPSWVLALILARTGETMPRN